MARYVYLMKIITKMKWKGPVNFDILSICGPLYSSFYLKIGDDQDSNIKPLAYQIRHQRGKTCKTSASRGRLSQLGFLSHLKTNWLSYHFNFKPKILLALFPKKKIKQRKFASFFEKELSQKSWLAFLKKKNRFVST